jgi:DNA polymerase-3 subunit gamma/tau
MPPAGDRTAGAAAPGIPVRAIGTFAELIALSAEKRDLQVKAALERDVRLVRCEDGKLEIALETGAAKTLVGELARKISAWTGRRWMVVVSAEAGAPTLRSEAEARRAELKRGVAADPLVQAVLARFPGAEIVEVREPEEASAAPTIDPDDPAPEPVSDESAFGAHSMPNDPDEPRGR